MDPCLSGKGVLILGDGGIAAAIDSAFQSAGATCLREWPGGAIHAGRRLHAFVHTNLGGGDEGESCLARVGRCFPDGIRHLIVVSPVFAPKNPEFVREASVEAWCRHVAARERGGPMNVNVLRYRRPPSAAESPGIPAHMIVPDEEIANAALALCSGRMDAVYGQTLIVDRGATFCDNPMRFYVEREQGGGAEPFRV